MAWTSTASHGSLLTGGWPRAATAGVRYDDDNDDDTETDEKNS